MKSSYPDISSALLGNQPTVLTGVQFLPVYKQGTAQSLLTKQVEEQNNGFIWISLYEDSVLQGVPAKNISKVRAS